MTTRVERRRYRRHSHRRRVPTRRTIGMVGVVVLVVVVAAFITGTFGHHNRNASTGHSPGTATATARSGKHAVQTTFQGPQGPEASWVVAENRKPGTTKWQISGPQSPNGIMGYASRVQARLGQEVGLYVSTAAPQFHVDAFRMGYYQGKGARLVWRSSEVKGGVQSPCPVTAGTNMVECQWNQSLNFVVTSAWVQGQYLLKLVGSTGAQSYVPLTVWEPASHATYVIMSGVLTEQVFNPFGGYDLYQGATPCAPNHYPCSTRARVVSFDRPYATGNGAGSYLGLTYPLTRMAEKDGLDVTYWTDILLAEHGNLLGHHKVLISPGHDEEWSQRMRQAAVSGRNSGVNLIFFGASPVLRKVRLQASPLGPDREVVNYRDPTKDPLYGINNAEVSQNWWGQPPANLPAHTLVGAEYIGYNNLQNFPLVVSDPTSWLFKGTGLAAGAQIPGVLASDFQAYDPVAANNPPGVEILAHSPVTVEYHPNRKFADTTYYTWPPSGAGVFQSGMVSWITSLGACPPGTASCPSKVMRQITGNLLRVFGAGPVGLRHPSRSNVAQFYG
ncbi:MAG: N,N-dimethylformamidase beta subunit family domain-containing protein [Acidimicrobiales bacterium]